MNILVTKQLFQWDTDRWVEIEKKEAETIESVQFSIDGKIAYEGKVKEGNKYSIPNQLLQHAGYLKCYVCVSDEYGDRTETRRSIKVFEREKPEGFVEEEEIPKWEEVENKIKELSNRLNAVANSDDESLDQLAELVAYIKENRNFIQQITSDKVNISDIIDNLTSEDSKKPLSATQGKVLKGLIDGINHSTLTKRDSPDAHPISAITGLEDALSGKQPVGTYLTEESDPTVPEWAKQPTKPTYTAHH